MTSKSSKVSILDKLKQANKVIDDLENNIYPNKEDDDEIQLPKYVSLVITRDKLHLVYEKRVNGNRLGLKMVLPIDHDLQEQIIILNEKIGLKYTGESII
jgi:ribosomal protein RSM22 (predicted rRNA methylase)